MNFLKKDPEPMPMPAPAQQQRRQMRISEQAAIAAQHVINLEDENDQLRSQYGVALNRVALLETHIHDLRRQLVELTQERDDYKHHYTHIYSSLQNAGSILVECMRVPPRAADNNDNNNGGRGGEDERIKTAVDKLELELGAEAAPAEARDAPTPAS